MGSRELSKTIEIGLDLMATSFVLAILILFISLSNGTFRLHEYQKGIKENTRVYADLYEYNGKAVSGSDVVDVILEYARVYDFNIDTGSGIIRFSNGSERLINTETGKEYGLSLWSRENILKRFGDGINYKYVGALVKETEYNRVIGIDFKKQ